MVNEEETKVVPKQVASLSSHCERNKASSSASSSDMSSQKKTSTSIAPRAMMDGLSAASLMDHDDADITDRSESTVGLGVSVRRIWLRLRGRLTTFIGATMAAKLVVVGGAILSVIAVLLRRTIIMPQFRLYLGLRRPNINTSRWFASNKLLFIVLAVFRLLMSLATPQMPFFEWIMDAIILIELLIDVIQLLLRLFLYFFPRNELNQDDDQKEDISPINGGCSNDESVNSELVSQQNDAASNSISHHTTNNFSRLEKVERIGAGAYGIVYVACDRNIGDLCAVKELNDIRKLKRADSLKREIEILSQLEHPNIVKYYGNEIVGHHISLYMEYIQPGSLKTYISKRGGLPRPLIQNFTTQILSGLVYLHSKRVVHRDIKPDNLLVDSADIVKLVDFGLAKHLAQSVGKHSELGTPYYAAPEVLQNIEYESLHEASAADIWSLGCVIIEMFSGRHPWPNSEPMQAFFKVCVDKEHPFIPVELCQEGQDFLKHCFTRTPAERPSAAALLHHPFLKPQTT